MFRSYYVLTHFSSYPDNEDARGLTTIYSLYAILGASPLYVCPACLSVQLSRTEGPHANQAEASNSCGKGSLLLGGGPHSVRLPCASLSAMKTLDPDTALDIVYGEKLVAVEDIANHRWYTSQLIVYSTDEGLYGFVYLKPATEMQEGGDYFGSIPVETFPVVANEVTVTRYERAS